MDRTIRARVKHGPVEPPLETIDVPDGTEVTVTVSNLRSADDFEAFPRAAGSWKRTIDAAELIRGQRGSLDLGTARAVSMTVRYLIDVDWTIHSFNGHPGIVATLAALKEGDQASRWCRSIRTSSSHEKEAGFADRRRRSLTSIS